MVDIHTHILPFVDDGSRSLEDSLVLLNEEKNSGVDTVVFTPHYKLGTYEVSFAKVQEIFEKFKEKVKGKTDINLILGREINVAGIDGQLSDEHKVTLGNSNCCLLEFESMYRCDVSDMAYTYDVMGYKPIIAHVERYSYCLDLDLVEKLKSIGTLIQCNASGVLGHYSKESQKFIFKLIKEGYVDFVASDTHFFRENHLKQAYDLILKKFGKKVTDDLFENNARKYLNV